jgi:ATP-dependent Lhr-like helicase
MSVFPPEAAGRWSLVDIAKTNATARAHQLASVLLERYGVVTRETVQAEGIAGGFSAVYPVLKAMEETGRVRRGYFVEGLGGAQFALPGAVDSLRAERDAPMEPAATVLAATDPAQPYGAALPWPRRDDEDRRSYARAAGAFVALADGEPVVYVERGLRGISTFPAFARPGMAEVALAAVVARPSWPGRRNPSIERIDGVPARESEHEALFIEAGFVAGYRGLSITAVRGADARRR